MKYRLTVYLNVNIYRPSMFASFNLKKDAEKFARKQRKLGNYVIAEMKSIDDPKFYGTIQL